MCDYCKGIGACPKCWGRAAINELQNALEEQRRTNGLPQSPNLCRTVLASGAHSKQMTHTEPRLMYLCDTCNVEVDPSYAVKREGKYHCVQCDNALGSQKIPSKACLRTALIALEAVQSWSIASGVAPSQWRALVNDAVIALKPWRT